MIRTQAALLRHAQDFFRSDMVGLYSWDRVVIAPPLPRPAIAPDVDIQKRRKEMEARQGLGRYVEQETIRFGPWEILIFSSAERGPVGEVLLRDFESSQVLVVGPLDPSTWSKIGQHIRANSHQRKAS